MEHQELAKSLLTRFKGLEEIRQPWVATWQELTEYMLPRKNSFTSAGSSVTLRGRSSDSRIFDSTPLHALELLASSARPLGGLLTNPDMPWFDVADFPYASVYLEVQANRIVEESGYLELPYMVPRWAKDTRGRDLRARAGPGPAPAACPTSGLARRIVSRPCP